MIVLAAIVVGSVFVVSGVLKIAAPRRWAAQSADLGVPRWVAAPLPFAELAIGALLVAQVARRAMAGAAVVLLAAFTVLLAVRLRQGRRPPCACFGVLSTKPIGWTDVVRNLALLGLAAVVAALG